MASMKMLKRALLLLVYIPIEVAYAQMVVIVNPGFSGTGANLEQVGNIFLSKADSLPGGVPLQPVDQTETSPTREAFYKAINNKDSVQMKAYWARLIFTGKAKPPAVVGQDAEVKQHVAKNPNAIGYISKSSVDSSVKVLVSP